MWQEYPFFTNKEMQRKPCVGISACLLGERVRYDGTSKIQPDLINQLDPLLTLKPLCPEVAIGMGVPRPPIQLHLHNKQIEAVYVEDQAKNFTQPLSQYAEQIIEESTADWKDESLCGYIFKSRSPSCGAGSTPVFSDGVHVRFGDGVYAHKIRSAMPWLPLMEEEELEHQRSRNRFLFLTYLISDYYHSVQTEEDQKIFFNHHHPLINGLARKRKNQLAASLEHALLPSSLVNAFDCALTVLTESLLETSHQEFENIVDNACNQAGTKKGGLTPL